MMTLATLAQPAMRNSAMPATPPTLMQLRDMLGRELIAQPNQPVLHSAVRVMTRAVERRGRLNKAQRLLAARAVALALDLARTTSLVAGTAEPMLSDALDPRKVPELGWWDRITEWWAENPKAAQSDPMLDLANTLDRGLTAVREGADQAVLDVANALDKAYEAVGESAQDFGNAALNATRKASFAAILPVGLGVALLLAFGWARRGGT